MFQKTKYFILNNTQVGSLKISPTFYQRSAVQRSLWCCWYKVELQGLWWTGQNKTTRQNQDHRGLHRPGVGTAPPPLPQGEGLTAPSQMCNLTSPVTTSDATVTGTQSIKVSIADETNERETFEDEVLCGSAGSLGNRAEQHSTTPGSRSRSTALTVNLLYALIHWLQPVNFLLLHGSPTATHLFVWHKFTSEQTRSLSLSTRHVRTIQEVSNRCRTSLDVWLPALLLLCSLTDSLTFEHTLLSGLLSLYTSPATRFSLHWSRFGQECVTIYW